VFVLFRFVHLVIPRRCLFVLLALNRKDVPMKLARRRISGCAMCCVALLAVATAAWAEEPKCATCPSSSAACQDDVWLARLPMVGRLFKNVQACEGAACCADALERIGIDFEFCPPPPGFAQVLQFSGLACPCENCACCPCTARSSTAASVSKCNAEHCNVAVCPEDNCGCENCPARHAVQHVDHLIAHAHPIVELIELFEEIAELSAEKAAAEAALEAREEAHEQIAELLESMIELATENAALEAKLAAQEEHMKLAEKLIELASENARLKAQVELADARHELMRESLEVAVENERLKTRVAELEKQQATATASRQRAAKQAR
jgi:hypothetical protein